MTIRVRFLLWYLLILAPLLLFSGYLEHRHQEGFYLAVTASRLQNDARSILDSRGPPMSSEPDPESDPEAHAQSVVRRLKSPQVDLIVFSPRGEVLASSEAFSKAQLAALRPPNPDTIVLGQTPNYRTVSIPGSPRLLEVWFVPPPRRPPPPGRAGGPPQESRPPRQGDLPPQDDPLGLGPGNFPGGPAFPGEPPGMRSAPEPIALITPLSVLDQIQRNNTAQWVGRMVAALAIAALALWLLLHAVLAPLERMAGTADAIAVGDTGLRMALPSSQGKKDELSRLADAFDRMLDVLLSSEAEMRRFLAEASHELRTPLTVVGGYVDVLLRGAGDRPEERARVFGAIREEVDRMARLVSELLVLARLQTSMEKEELRREGVPLLPMLEELVHQARFRDASRRMTIDAGDHATEDLSVLGDPDRLRQAFQNLIDNVLLHTRPGGALEIRVIRAPGDRRVAIVFRDEGPPMSADLLPRLFGRFVKGKGSTGSGLGLSIAQAVVSAHGGSIRAETDGTGNRFIVELPLAAPSPAPLKIH